MKRPGFTLVEILVAIGFVAAMTLLMVSATTFSHNMRRSDQERTQAGLYAQGALEAVRQVSWSTIANGSYHPVIDASQKWSLVVGTEVLDTKFTRSVQLDDVRRATNQNGQISGTIVSSGGYIDPTTKKATATITWNGADGPKSLSLETYIHVFAAARWVQTDWSGGAGQASWATSNRFFSKDAGADITTPGISTLKAGLIDWTQATTTATYDTPGNFDNEDVFEVNNKAYLVTDNNSSGPEFYILDVTDIHSPYSLGNLDIGDGVNAVVVSGNYAYIATKDNSKELQVVDITNSASPSVVASYNLPGNNDGQDVAVDENEVYIIQGSTLYAYHKGSNGTLVSDASLSVSGNASQIYINQHFLYVTSDSSSQELQIYDATTPTSMYLLGRYNLPGALKANDVFVLGSRAYVVTQNNSSGPEFFALDISAPNSPQLLGSYDVGQTVYSLAVVGSYALLGTNFSNKELEVLDVSEPTSISYVSGFNLSGFILGMTANCSIIYAATSSNTEEFFIISTEVTDCDYANSGQIESSTYDIGSDKVVYNWIAWSGYVPFNTSIKFQIATSATNTGPWLFVGPDGTPTTYYTNSAQEPINFTSHQDQRYIRYRAYLASQADLTAPILEEVRISYSSYE